MEVLPWWVFGLPVIALVNCGVGCPKTTEFGGVEIEVLVM
jgi:hypothetical protein